jgi:hypothetical protein
MASGFGDEWGNVAYLGMLHKQPCIDWCLNPKDKALNILLQLSLTQNPLGS